MKPARRLGWVLLVAAALACGERGDPVKATLDRMVKAVHDRNADAFMDNIAADFTAGEAMSRADAQRTLKSYFAAYAILDAKISDLTIERAESAARARFTAELGGQPQKVGGLDGLLPRASSWKFDLRLVPDGSRYKIAWASWEPASR